MPGWNPRADDTSDRRLFERANGPLEFRFQIVVEVSAAGDERPVDARGMAPVGSRLPQVFEAACAALGHLSEGFGVRTATLAWPSGMRVVAQGSASPEDLAGIQAAASALGRE